MPQGHGRKDDEYRNTDRAEDSRAVASRDESALRLFGQPGRLRDGSARHSGTAIRWIVRDKNANCVFATAYARNTLEHD